MPDLVRIAIEVRYLAAAYLTPQDGGSLATVYRLI
jgi:hypothetical protein